MAQKKRNIFNSEQEGKKDERPKPRFSIWIYTALFLFLLVLNFYFWNEPGRKALPYSKFLEYVEKGYVEKVEIVNDATVRGWYTPDAVREKKVEVIAPPSSLMRQQPADFRRRFVTEKPADHDLTAFLEAYNKRAREAGRASVEFSAHRESDWVSGLLTWIFPLTLIVLLWVFLFRRMNPGQQVLNIGKNRASLFRGRTLWRCLLEWVQRVFVICSVRPRKKLLVSSLLTRLMPLGARGARG